MGSVGFGEIALIAIVVLLVFGPERLPELSRKAGELMTKAREATKTFTDALDSEFEDSSAPIRSLKADFDATKDELTNAASTVLNFDAAPDSKTSEGAPTVEADTAADGDEEVSE